MKSNQFMKKVFVVLLILLLCGLSLLIVVKISTKKMLDTLTEQKKALLQEGIGQEVLDTTVLPETEEVAIETGYVDTEGSMQDTSNLDTEGSMQEISNLDTEASIQETSDSDTEMSMQETSDVETEVTIQEINDKEAFYYSELPEEIKAKITGVSYPQESEGLEISYEDLAYVHVLHYDFEGNIQEGELVCNQVIAADLVDIFTQLYENQYQIESIHLIDEYGGDDDLSMEANNTSCFNYRVVEGTTKLSKHAYGLAIDINPLYNPYVFTRNGISQYSPDNSGDYLDRTADFPHKINSEDLCYQLFTEHGFFWGGNWKNSKDYQHFQKEY